MSGVYKHIKPVRTPRSLFDLSYSVKTSMSMGKLYPIMCDEIVPGDSFKIANSVVIRFQPLVAPILHEINAYIHYFFVPYRILSDSEFDWEKFITGFEETNVDENGDLQEYNVPLPRWIPSDGKNVSKSLWDYLGFPVGVNPEGAYPLDFPRRAYNMIWNEYYRDETLMPKVDLDNEDILYRCWEKDYFTSSLPFQQRGTSPAIPISGVTHAEFPHYNHENNEVPSYWDDSKKMTFVSNTDSYGLRHGAFPESATTDSEGHILYSGGSVFSIVNNETFNTSVDGFGASLYQFLNNNTVDFNNIATAEVNDLRLAFQIQKWMERNARAGVRYTEFLRAHYGVSPRDERLQRPEYIGGSKSPIIVEDVVQNSMTVENATPQGNLAGKALTATSQYCGKYFATEFGLIMGIMSIMPRLDYGGQGINRQWLRRTKYDFFSPEFQNLSEQAIENAEIFAQSPESGETTQPDNVKIFGFQGRYDELRSKQNMITGEMRSLYDYWHLARKFENLPKLGQEFLECKPDDRIFAVQDADQYDQMIVEVRNIVRAVRPLGYAPEPGLIDHV